MSIRTALLPLLCTALLLPFAARAQNSQDFGDYIVYYNAFTTDFLQPATARRYGITRSKHRGMVNISVQRKRMNTVGEPVEASITGNATNLNAQIKNLSLREIKEGNAVYYIAEFPVSNMETLDFKLQVTPKGQSTPLHVEFRQQFYTE